MPIFTPNQIQNDQMVTSKVTFEKKKYVLVELT